ncbi:Zinc finger FYVE domain-containing protein 26 [Amphibalanus amphitrite]|uniref:Zinc finger FYVE domain-containing protein 26 n=1 Tax=Amphibalanus amphitrite TaxID=1232801 RepID=A0A6A4WNB5_AMPAM|nr:Zinc finger FYVE domain-containing protein 26 [Amphibalanus amphitrite]
MISPGPQMFPESSTAGRLRAELAVAEGLKECRRSLDGPQPPRSAPEEAPSAAPAEDTDGDRTDGADDSTADHEPESTGGHLRRTIGRLALRALNSDTALYRVISLVERHKVTLPGTGGHYEGLSAGYAAFFDLALTSDCRELFTRAASCLQEALIIEPNSAAGLSALTAAVRHWLSVPSEAARLAPQLAGRPGPAAVLLSSAPLGAQLAQAAGRRWRRLVELAGRPADRDTVTKLAALAHRLAPAAGAAAGSHEHRPDFLMSLLHCLSQLQTMLPDLVPAAGDCLHLLTIPPSLAVADLGLRCTSPIELTRLSARAGAVRLDLGRLMLGRLWPQLETPGRAPLWEDDTIWVDLSPASASGPGGGTSHETAADPAPAPVRGRRRSLPVSSPCALSPSTTRETVSLPTSATVPNLSTPAASKTADSDSPRLVDRLRVELLRLADRLAAPAAASTDPPPQEPSVAALGHLGQQSGLLAELQTVLSGGGGGGCRLLRAASADGPLAALTAEGPARARLAVLLRAVRWTEAAEMALSLQFLPEMDGATDAVLAARVLNSDGDADTGWRLVQHISSERRRAAVISEMAGQWPLRRCLDLLTGLDGQESLRERLLLSEELLQLWRQCRGPPVPCWAELERRCRRQPALLTELLAAAGADCRPTLYHRWGRLHGADGAELPPPPGSSDRLAALLREPAAAPVTAVKQLLRTADPAEVVSLCGRLQSVAARAALLSGLCAVQGEQLPPSQFAQLYRHAAGLRLLGLLGSGWPHYQHLAARPELIVIQLICNQHFQTAGRALRLLWRLGLITGSVQSPSGGRSASAPGRARPPDLPHPVPPLDAAVNGCLERLAERALDVSRLPAPPPQLPPSLPLAPPPPAAAPRQHWAADHSSNGCMRCGAAFNARFRRHHCRRCGKLVCEPCSKHRVQLDGCGPAPVRVCSVCVMAVSEQPGGDQLSPDDVTRAREPCSAGPPALRLTDSAAHNVRQLERVQFGHAPSVSTCLLLLQLHTDAAAGGRLVLRAARQLLWQPPPAAAAHPALTAGLARQLALAAKLLLARAERPAEEMAACDALLRAADVSRLLEEAGCGELSAGADLSDRAALRRLQAAMVGRELWRPALDVSTKAGLDCGAVWAAWGLATLRAGELAAARPRLARALRPAAEPDRRREQARLLSAVVAALEAVPAAADAAPAALLRAEAELAEICAGRLPTVGGAPPPAALDEAVYYLSTYGSARQTLSLLQRHGLYGRAAAAVRELTARPEDFHRALLVPAVRRGQLQQLLDALRKDSPSLRGWKVYLEFSCAELQQSGAWHTLLQLQLACGDLLRAANTCIRLYCRQTNYRCYAQSLHHLEAARDRLSEYLNRADWKAARAPSGRIPLVLPWKQVSQQLTAVELQIQQDECALALRWC